MKPIATLLAVLFFGAQALGAAPKNLVVHEWGVFRVNEHAAMANADLRAVWDTLPPFVYGHVRGRQVPQHWGAVEIRDKPILFFHADGPGQFAVKVEFPGGMPGVWWPGTQVPALEGIEQQPAVGKLLQWDLSVKQPAAGWRPKTPAPPPVEKGHWFEGLRQVNADEIFARFGPGGHYIEREKFLYYDGLFPQGKWLKVEVSGDKIELTSRIKHAVFDVTIVDRRQDDKARVGRLEKLEAGAKADVVFADADASRFASTAAEALVKQVVAAGLQADEAKTLADLWRKDMFETPGLHVFYRLPNAEYDRLLPLTITPPASSVVRVGLVYQGHVEPDFAERVRELVIQLDSPRFAVRDAARKKLLQLGPAALVHLQGVKIADLSAEVRKQLEALIKQWSAKEAFE
jgi:hypothetical protein